MAFCGRECRLCQTYGVALDASLSEIGNVQAWQLTLSSSGADAVCVQYVELAWMDTPTSGFDVTGLWPRLVLVRIDVGYH